MINTHNISIHFLGQIFNISQTQFIQQTYLIQTFQQFTQKNDNQSITNEVNTYRHISCLPYPHSDTIQKLKKVQFLSQ
jgi:hypothetical protein